MKVTGLVVVVNMLKVMDLVGEVDDVIMTDLVVTVKVVKNYGFGG